jgi:hypothetical protein
MAAPYSPPIGSLMANESFKDNLLLNSPEVRAAIGVKLREYPIVDERSYIQFLNEIMISAAVGQIPPDAVDSINEMASSIYQALTMAATMEVVRAQTKNPKALPLPTMGRGDDVLEVVFEPAYTMEVEPSK